MRRIWASLFVGAAMLCGFAPAHAADNTKALADRFFTAPGLRETRALLVIVNGQTVYERYAPGYGPGNRFIGWSMTKSITGTLVGQLVDAGRLTLAAPAPVAAWHARADDPRGKIRLVDLVHMSSGLSHQETSDTPEDDDTVRVLFTDRAGDAAARSEAKPLYAPPGTDYRYSTATSVILADIVQNTLFPGATPAERRVKMRAYLVEHLIRPAAMPSLICEFDRAGTLLGGSFCHASARDWARFGEAYLHDGMGPGGRVVSPAWVRFVRTPSPTDGSYGGQWWLNNSRRGDKEDALFPGIGPADAYSAIGHLGQYVIVVPSRRAVIVRLGNTPDNAHVELRRSLGLLAASLPTP